MKYKSTLEIFDELVAGGCTESQARAQANQLGSVSEFLNDFKNDFDFRMSDIQSQMTEIKKDLNWMRIIGAAMIVTFLSNIVMMRL